MRSLLATLLVCVSFVSTTAFAQPDDHPAKVELLANVSSIKPGEPFTVGVRFTMRPHWHVYWINPGDSGMPPEVKWKLPEGFTVSELQFPVPKKFDQPGDMVGYGYEDEVFLTATVTPPKELKQGGSVTIGGDASWLVCDPSVCIPGDAKLSINLPVSESAAPAHRALFEGWSRRLPQIDKDIGATTTVTKEWTTNELDIRVGWKGELPKVIDWFPPPADDVSFADVRMTTVPEGPHTRVLIRFAPLAKRSLPQVTMQSLLVYDPGDGTRRGLVIPLNLRSNENDIPLPTD
jgi:DsbC/DsbD-like thiol-disulfide interchange protein